MLPVHLHPDDETARERHGEPHGKAEAWHILWAAEGATILAGIEENPSREELFGAFKAQDYDAVMPRRDIAPGDTVYVPGGILHTFGPDTLILEVQQTSDLGQFVMPFDLYGNRLDEDEWDANIEATLDELKTDFLPRPNPGLVVEDNANTRVLCCAGPHFALERWTLAEAYTEPSHPRRCFTLSNVGETPVELEYEGGTRDARTRREPRHASRDRRGEGGSRWSRGGQPGGVLRPRPPARRRRAAAGGRLLRRGDTGPRRSGHLGIRVGRTFWGR